MSVVLIHPEIAQQRPPTGARGRCLSRRLSACSMEEDMAKGQLRSNREKKKPKADKNKSKASKPASPWASTQFEAKSARPSTGKNSHEG